jgi:hypothetical protein
MGSFAAVSLAFEVRPTPGEGGTLMLRTMALSALLLAVATGAFAAAPDPFADWVVAYDPGAWAGDEHYLQPESGLGPPTAVILDGTVTRPDYAPYGWREVVTLGEGGTIVYGFDEPIVDDPLNPGGFDFIVFGNTFFWGQNRYDEPGMVYVSADGIDFYLVTTSYADHNVANGEAMLAAGSGVVFDAGSGDFMDGLYTLQPFPGPDGEVGTDDDFWGPFLPDPDPNDVYLAPWSCGGDAFDLADAVDAFGNPVALSQVSYVMVIGGADVTTEIDAIVDVVPVVPEPGLLTVAGLGLVVVAFRRRR